MYHKVYTNSRKGLSMTVALKQWGNSLALRIPKDIANTLSIAYDSNMELSIVDGALVLKPQNSSRLESLVSQITSDNMHREVDTGKSVGNEEW